MAAPGPSARPPQKPSRLPLHRSRPSTDKSSPALPAPSPVFHAENSHMSVSNDISKRSERLSSGSRPAHNTTQVRMNRMSVQGRQDVADGVPPRRRSQPQMHSRVRDASVSGVVGISSAAAAGQNHRRQQGDFVDGLVDGGAINDAKYSARLSDIPSCGVRMSALRSAGREQQSSPTSSSTSSDRHASAVRRRCDVTVGAQYEPRDTALSPRVSTSSVDSTSSDYLLRQAAPVAQRHLVRFSTSSSATDDSANRQHSGRGSRASRCRPKSETSDCDEITTSSRSGCLGPPVFLHLPAASQQTNKLQLQRRSEGYHSTSGVCRPTDLVRNTERRQRSVAAIVEPQRRYYHLWRLSETDVDDFSVAGSMSTIASIDSSSSSSSSKSSSGTLTDDADESTDESTTTSDRERHLQDHHHLDTSDISSAGPAFILHAQPPLYRDSICLLYTSPSPRDS